MNFEFKFSNLNFFNFSIFQIFSGSQLLSDFQTFFSWEPAPWTPNSRDDDVDDVVVKKSIAIFGHKQWLLSIDMKTKVVQHVPRINLSYLKFQIFKFLKNFKFSKIFKFSNFLWFPAFVWLSDIFLYNCTRPFFTTN